MSDVRFGLIGCGPMGRRLADSLKGRGDSHVVAVADPDDGARQLAAATYRADGYAGHQELLARKDLDAVLIATPSYLHKEIAVRAAEAGKHVFCEKPMALSTADCDAMLRAAKGTGIKLMVGHVLRLMFPWWRIKELAREDELGAPVCVSIRRYHSRSGGGWRARTELSGGSLFEVNIHELDLMRHLCGEVSQVSAYEGRLGCGERDHDEVYLINFRFRSGAVGHLQGGATTGGALYEGQVMCPGGVLSFGPAWGTGAVQRGDGDRQPLAAEGRTGPVGVDWELDSFMRWVTDDEPPVVTAEDGRAAVRLAEAARRAITDGVPVDLL